MKKIGLADIINASDNMLLKYQKEITRVLKERNYGNSFRNMSTNDKITYMNDYLAKRGISENIRFNSANIRSSVFYGIKYDENLVTKEYLDELFNKNILKVIKLASKIEDYTKGSVKLKFIDPYATYIYKMSLVMEDSNGRTYEIYFYEQDDFIKITRIVITMENFLTYHKDLDKLFLTDDYLKGLEFSIYIYKLMKVTPNVHKEIVKMIDSKIFEIKEKLKEKIDNM